MTPTKRFWTAKPLLIAYVVAVGFTVALLVNRTPRGRQMVPAMAASPGTEASSHDQEAKQPPIWVQFFRPSQAMARRLLRAGLPLLSVADGSALESQKESMVVYWAGKAGEQPQSFFQIILPFLRPAPPVADRPPAPPPGPQGPPAPAKPGPTTTPSAEPTPTTEPPKVEPKVVNNGQPLVGIYHTHDWESYLSEFPGKVVTTRDQLDQLVSYDHKVHTVMDVGNALAIRLQDLGVGVVHSTAKHQKDGYDYAYQDSRVTAKKVLSQFASVKILLDIHRDGVLGVKSTAKVGGKPVAQVRCIIGQFDQPNWSQNKAFCDRVMGRMEQVAPGTTLATRIQNDTYNQDLMPGALLFEIGNALDNYDDAVRAAQLLAQALGDVVRSGEYPK